MTNTSSVNFGVDGPVHTWTFVPVHMHRRLEQTFALYGVVFYSFGFLIHLHDMIYISMSLNAL